jgi:hypothetical protein
LSGALQYILGPEIPATFIERDWERHPVCVRRGEPSYFDELFSMDAADELLARSDIWWPGIRIFHQGQQIEGADYTEHWLYGRERFDRIIDRARVLDWLSKGATINLLGLERAWPPIMRVNRSLEEETGYPVHTTAFLTPRLADNIPAHYDMVEFFCLQVAGRKTWRIWKPDRPLPLVDGPDASNRVYCKDHKALRREREVGDYLLEPGDTLYVPRGWIHQAVTIGEPSLHVTIGVNVHRWLTLIEHLARAGIRRLAEDVEFRRALPPRGSPSRPEASDVSQKIFMRMSEVLREFMNESLEQGLREIDRALLDGRHPARPGQLIELIGLDDLRGDDVLMRRAGVPFALIESNDRILLRFHGKSLSCARKFGPALRFIAAAGEFKVEDLPELPDANERLGFARRMISEGVLTRSHN